MSEIKYSEINCIVCFKPILKNHPYTYIDMGMAHTWHLSKKTFPHKAGTQQDDTPTFQQVVLKKCASGLHYKLSDDPCSLCEEHIM